MIIILLVFWFGGALGYFLATMVEKDIQKEKNNESAFKEKNER